MENKIKGYIEELAKATEYAEAKLELEIQDLANAEWRIERLRENIAANKETINALKSLLVK